MNASSSGYFIQALTQIPDLLGLHAKNPQRYPHYLCSAATGTAQGRFDILFAFPGDCLILSEHGLSLPDELTGNSGGFLDALQAWWQQSPFPSDTNTDVPFRGGWFLFLAYELAAEIEPTLHLPADHGALPIAMATRFQNAVIIDHEKHCAFIVTEDNQLAREQLAAILIDIESTTDVGLSVDISVESMKKTPLST